MLYIYGTTHNLSRSASLTNKADLLVGNELRESYGGKYVNSKSYINKQVLNHICIALLQRKSQ